MGSFYTIKNLKNLDTERFRANPIVLYNWNYSSPEAIVGKCIYVGTNGVEIEYIDGAPKYDHHIGTSWWVNPETLQKELLALAVLPRAKKPKVL